jgi:hypothetical protein
MVFSCGPVCLAVIRQVQLFEGPQVVVRIPVSQRRRFAHFHLEVSADDG